MKILYEGGQAETVEKKSRFIATLQPVKEEKDAIAFIEKMKKEYWNASHNCSAFVIGDRNQIQRCSDDGEPQGTAGRPMLDVLLGEGVHDMVVVVTRYFGGTLLGTGGLVRAYSKAVQEGLKQSLVIEKKKGYVMKLGSDYQGVGKIQYLLGSEGIPILDSEYTDRVTLDILVPETQKDDLIAKITEGTSGRTEFLDETEKFYARIKKEIIFF